MTMPATRTLSRLPTLPVSFPLPLSFAAAVAVETVKSAPAPLSSAKRMLVPCRTGSSGPFQKGIAGGMFSFMLEGRRSVSASGMRARTPDGM